MVYRPPEQEDIDLSKLNTSAADMYSLFCSQREASNQAWIWVDVRDVALASVLALARMPVSVESESPAASNQRYLISCGPYSAQQFLDYIWHPERAKAKNISKGTPGKLYPEEGTYTSDNSKSKKDLGLTYRNLDTMMDVLLTGANGFLGYQITKSLLERGHTVVGTVRSESKTKYLKEKFSKFISEDEARLKFAVVEDIATPGSFDEVLKTYQFDAVIHSSSPFITDVKDVEEDLYRPAIQGTLGILESIKANAPTVKRVVVTSSFAAVNDLTKGQRPEHTYTEEDWSPITREDGLENPRAGYTASKKLAEEAAWNFVKTKNPGFALTTICPPMIYGPPEQETGGLSALNTSAAEIYAYFCGTREPANRVWLWVDVRDVALAHVLAAESTAANNQRYLVTAGNYSAQQFSDYIWKYYPERAASRNISKGTPGQLYPERGVYKADNSKSKKDLGLAYRNLETTLKDMLGRFEEIETETGANA
ncbi:methylglyoxal reductase (NADPH-dependent) gre2 [Tulasnella sp. 417]|nr:methylglyoxal reductase (NADPH-dependent) gre2 [Tulasnella sp. 417]